MPRGPKGQKPPADVIGNAVRVKDKAAQSLGQRGGQARARAQTAKRRSEIAHAAAQARWKKKS